MSLKKTALLIIDVQKAYTAPQLGSSRSNPSFEANITAVIKYFRSQPDVLIVNVQHNSRSLSSPFHPSKPGNEFCDFARPLEGEVTISKDVNSAFIGTDLEEVLRGNGVERLVVVGLTIDQCVSTTVRMASNLGVCEREEIVLVEDACMAHGYAGLDAETIHKVHEATLGHEFCRVVRTEDVLAGLV